MKTKIIVILITFIAGLDSILSLIEKTFRLFKLDIMENHWIIQLISLIGIFFSVYYLLSKYEHLKTETRFLNAIMKIRLKNLYLDGIDASENELKNIYLGYLESERNEVIQYLQNIFPDKSKTQIIKILDNLYKNPNKSNKKSKKMKI